MGKKCLLVLSMHRSGSSCASGSMQFLGTPVTYGIHHLLEKNQWNSKGFFENGLLLRFNEKMLRSIKSSWKTVHTWTPTELRVLMRNVPELIEILRSDFLSQPEQIFVIKDPRIIFLWPLYIAALKELKVEVFVLQVDRDNSEAAKSLFDPHKVPYESALALTIAHKDKLAENIKEIPSNNYCFIKYPDLLESPVSVLEKVAETLKIDSKLINISGITNFVDRKLKHY